MVDSDNNRIRQIGDIVLSVFEEKEKITDSVVYPNPSTGVFEFDTELFPNPFTLRVYNQLGVELFSLQNENKIDLSSFPNGHYNLLILSEEGYAIHKLMLQR